MGRKVTVQQHVTAVLAVNGFDHLVDVTGQSDRLTIRLAPHVAARHDPDGQALVLFKIANRLTGNGLHVESGDRVLTVTAKPED